MVPFTAVTLSPLVGSGSLGCFQEHLRKDLSALRSFGLKGMRRPMRGKEIAYGERSCVLEIVLCLWVPASSKCYGNSEGRFEERRRQDRRHKRRVKSHTLVFLRCVGCRRSKASMQTGRIIALGLWMLLLHLLKETLAQDLGRLNCFCCSKPGRVKLLKPRMFALPKQTWNSSHHQHG